MAGKKLPEGYPSEQQIPLPKGEVRFYVTGKQFKFVLEQSHKNPFSGEMMQMPEAMNRRWPSSAFIVVHPQSDPAVFMYLMTSPLCGQHPDFNGQKHKNIKFDLFDPSKDQAKNADRAKLIGVAVKAVQDEYGSSPDDRVIKGEALIQAVRNAGLPVSTDPEMNYATLLGESVKMPRIILEKALRHADYVPSEKLKELVLAGLVKKEGSNFVVYAPDKRHDLGLVNEANILLTKPQSKKYQAIKPFITLTETND